MSAGQTNHLRCVQSDYNPETHNHALLIETRTETSESYDALCDLEWHEEAACRDMGPEIFFPTSGDALEPARRVCARCAVIAKCRMTALNDPSLQGVWAGTSARERTRMRTALRLTSPYRFEQASMADRALYLSTPATS
jgi:WhiB family redox-sensing transcriptional regulator